jgi:hypothetical protein
MTTKRAGPSVVACERHENLAILQPNLQVMNESAVTTCEIQADTLLYFDLLMILELLVL